MIRNLNPENKIPVKPRILQGIAKTEWHRITKLLHGLGLLTDIDRTALTVYCQYYQRWCEAEKAIRKEGMVTISPKGYPMQNPHLSIANKAVENMKKMLIEFGMTPASRSRVMFQIRKNHKPVSVKFNAGLYPNSSPIRAGYKIRGHTSCKDHH